MVMQRWHVSFLEIENEWTNSQYFALCDRLSENVAEETRRQQDASSGKDKRSYDAGKHFKVSNSYPSLKSNTVED